MTPPAVTGEPATPDEHLAPATPAEIASVERVVAEWAERELATNSLVVAVEPVPAERRWLVRLRGEEKTNVTIWLTVRERTLHFEAYFMPAPEANMAACWEYLLRVNQRLYGMRFAIGAEDAVYLVGQLPLARVDAVELDRIVGGLLAYSEQYFPQAMAIGYGSRYRRHG